MTEMNPMIKLPLCQWLLSHLKERQKVLPGTRLPKPEQMDNTESIPTPTDQRSYLRPSWILFILQIQRTMGIQQYPYQEGG
jgi:hypothetical protein